MSQRLTNYLKETILEQGTAKKKKAIEKRVTTFKIAIEKSLQSKMESWFKKEYGIDVKTVEKMRRARTISGCSSVSFLNTKVTEILQKLEGVSNYSVRCGLSFVDYGKNRKIQISMPNQVPVKDYQRGHLYELNKREMERLSSIVEEIVKFDEEKKALQSVLNSVTTVKKLLSVLPEVKKYLPEVPEKYDVVSMETIDKAKAVMETN